ncbi:MAG: N-6 DNA methylase [Chloroflexales bacterium]
MSRRSRDSFITIRSEGAILPADLLQRIVDGGPRLDGLTPASYHLVEGERITEAINRSWSRLLGLWTSFRGFITKVSPADAATGVTRDRWLLPLFQELGYGRLQTAKAVELNGKSYALSHAWGHTPIHLVGCRVDLDRRTPGVAGAAKGSPHSLLQEVLNGADASLWGFVANGLQLRVLRDSARLTRQAYVEFDLEAMFDGQIYADFVLLWLVCHQSRVESDRPETCWLERWSYAAQEQGTRALDQLRNGVEEAITALGCGFLAHRANEGLRERLRSGELITQDYYRQLLRMVYRLLFLFVAEDRDVLLDPEASAEARERYTRFYAISRLRQLAERRIGTRHADLYYRMRLVMRLLGSDEGSAALGLPALGGFLFAHEAVPDLDEAEIANHDFLDAVRALAFIIDRHGRRAVDYKNLGAEELGSVYESLLELHPALSIDAPSFELQTAGGSERKTSGSYYTPTSLITSLLNSALDPVLDEAARQPDPKHAILDLKILDPACGSGHFLIAAAHRLAHRLAAIRTGDEAPAPEATRAALRDVIGSCIYGVDINPMSVELCKVSLWMEALDPGKPLSFLDHHIQCGNSLIGATPALLARGVPEEAFTPVIGDDKAVCSGLRKRNKAERAGQLSFLNAAGDVWPAVPRLAEYFTKVDAIPDRDIAGVRLREDADQRGRESPSYRRAKLAADAWCAAFFWRKDGAAPPPITHDVFERLSARPESLPDLAERQAEIERLVMHHGFFHWHLAFPSVFTVTHGRDEVAEAAGAGWEGGFDVVLGNPPWERIKLQEQEWFATREPSIANATNKAARERLIRELPEQNYVLHLNWQIALRSTESESQFLRTAGRFPLTGVGDVNTYALFAEHFRTLLKPRGRAGIIVPTGIATDDTTKQFFGDLVERQTLVQIIGFENEAFIFRDVHHSFRFCLLTMSGVEGRVSTADFAYMVRYVEDVSDPQRHFALSRDEIALLNPNTHTCPIFRNAVDAKLAKQIYRRVPVLADVAQEESPWGVRFLTMFHMANDSHLFTTTPAEDLLPLYEAKLMHQFDHRYSTYEGARVANLNAGILPQPSLEQKANPAFVVRSRYWVARRTVEERLAGRWDRGWLLGFRDVCRSHDERSAIFSLIPRVAVGHKMPLLFPAAHHPAPLVACFFATLNSPWLDYFARQKIGGASLSFFILRQLPILPPSAFSTADIAYITTRVVELVYTAWDMAPFAADIWAAADEELRAALLTQNAECNTGAPEDLFRPQEGLPLSPFRWSEGRRASLRAELDARIAKLYGLTRDELRYILNPQDVYGPDFPGETFRVLREKELKQFGEYRTRRLVLEAWDREKY